ncbi:DC-STAMP domain-containing protein 2-like isoform X2 [Cimex lectularius]|uniref:Dendritic cell-specific transmembrane protein-like domain-containing protein n=1 Tax=Cimex lectularius TaxID=79782 RepID=A0A8I6RUU4_CIMLE|nr:DC-STAMP domain-containing protein 2-like isoform X2 [Cimex lectularius]
MLDFRDHAQFGARVFQEVQLFSKKGRQALIAYAFILVLTGPARNALHNARVLSESMVCEQEKLKRGIRSMLDMVKKPFIAIKHSIEQIMAKIKGTFKKIKYLVSTVTRTILDLLGVIKSAFDWLNSVAGVCNKKIGTPYARCVAALESAVLDCKDKLPPSLHWMCSITYVSNLVCYSVKFIDYVCVGFEFISDDLVQMTKRRLKEFSHHIKNIFYVSVEFKHKLEYEETPSKNASDIAAGIAGEIRARTSAILALFDWMSFAFSFFFLYTIFQTLKYRRDFLLKDWYDNRFITDNFIQIDLKRTYMGKESLLPLTLHEKRKYIRINSLCLVQSEKQQLIKTAIYLTLATIKLSIHMLADYSLFWILSMIRYHGQFQTDFDATPEVEIKVNGKGILADIYLSIVKAFQPENLSIERDTTSCLPDPKPPDMAIYRQIVSLIVLCWLLSILEAYGLRLRNWIMCYYYPDVARKRSVWLYNHINSRRSTFVKYTRRQLRKKYGLDYKGDQMLFMDQLRYRCPIIAKLCGLKQPKACVVCGSVSKTSVEPLIQCETPNCVGVYCTQCYTELKKVCTICQSPINYGDISDMSEEMDSSDVDNGEEFPLKRLKHEKIRFNYETSDSDGGRTGPTSDDELDYSYQKKKRTLGYKPFSRSFEVEEKAEPSKIRVNDVFTQNEAAKRKQDKVSTSKSLFHKKMSGVLEIFPRLKILKRLIPSKNDDQRTSDNNEECIEKRVEHKTGIDIKQINEKRQTATKVPYLTSNTDIDSSDSETSHLIKKLKTPPEMKARFRTSQKSTDNSSESDLDKRKKIQSILLPTPKNSSVDLTKMDGAMQTDFDPKPFCYAPIRTALTPVLKQDEQSNVQFLGEKLFAEPPNIKQTPKSISHQLKCCRLSDVRKSSIRSTIRKRKSEDLLHFQSEPCVEVMETTKTSKQATRESTDTSSNPCSEQEQAFLVKRKTRVFKRNSKNDNSTSTKRYSFFQGKKAKTTSAQVAYKLFEDE